MIYDLKNFNDLGKCSMGTLIETFNTDDYEIYLLKDGAEFSFEKDSFEKIEITCFDDLLELLWSNPALSHSNNETHKHTLYFSSKRTWYENYYGRVMNDSVDYLLKTKRRKREEIVRYADIYASAKKRIEKLDEQRKQIIVELKKDNVHED